MLLGFRPAEALLPQHHQIDEAFMRTYGRTHDTAGNPTGWVVIETDDQGHNDYVWAVTVAQTILLNLGESPVYGNYGIPAQQTIMSQVYPDYYITQIQQQYAQYFASLTIQKLDATYPSYKINIMTNQGTVLQFTTQSGVAY